jgi:amidase
MRWMLALAMALPLPALLVVPLPAGAQTAVPPRRPVVERTQEFLERIEANNRKGPELRAVIAVTPDAIDQARAADGRMAGHRLSPIDGVVILVKDNIETRDLPTTAGSLALADNRTGRDAPVVARLRSGGAVILGKTNLSEWANIRSNASMSGWSAVGGLVRNPYALDRTACGSSSGSGAAVAAGFADAALGTETDGSIVCPASMNGVVGLKPTMGLVSRTYVVPISHSQDTPGPMTRTVPYAAMLLGVMAGSDPADAATAEADAHKQDYVQAMHEHGLKGRRVAYYRPAMSPALAERFDAALAVLRAAGAVPVEVKLPDLKGLGGAERTVLYTELRVDLDAYLATTPSSVKTRTLEQVIAFNKAQADAEMPFFGQETFEAAMQTKGLDDPAYKAALALSRKLATDALEKMLADGNADLLVTPTYGTAWLSDPVNGDQYDGPSASTLPAVSGWPHLTVPMGLARGLPVGLSFIGRPWSEGLLLGAGYVFEEKRGPLLGTKPDAAVDLGPRAIK